MRLALIVNSFPTLSETFIVNKVLGLHQTGLDVTVWVHSKRDDATAFADRLRAHRPIQVKAVLFAKGNTRLFGALFSSLVKHPRRASQLWRQSRAHHADLRRAARAWLSALPIALENFDLIHFELSGLAVAYLDAFPLLRPAKLLTSCRGAAEQIAPAMYPQRAQQLRQVFAQVDAVHCVSADLQRTATRYGLRTDKSFINHPAIDVEQFVRRQPVREHSHPPYRVLSVGRLHWKKGYEFGLLAIAELVKAGLDVHYRIIGGGVEEEKLRYLIAELGLADRVALSGRQTSDEIRQALEEADVFLLPSLSEGLSNAVLEAMAMEVPVICTTAGGMEEAITDGHEGFLVASMDPQALAGKTKQLLENPKLRLEMGRRGRQRVERDFNLEHQIRCFVEQYSRLIRSDGIS